MKLIKFLLVIFLWLFTQVQIDAQTNMDSFERAIKKSNIDTIKILLSAQLAKEYTHSYPKKARQLADYTLKLSKKIKFYKGVGLGEEALGSLDLLDGDYLNGYERFYNALSIYKKMNFKKEIPTCLNNIAVMYYYQGYLDKALENYLSALKLSKELKNTKLEATCLNNVGIVFYAQNQTSKSITYYEEALKIYKKINFKDGIAESYNFLGWSYSKDKKYQQALLYFLEATKIFEKQSDKLQFSRNLSSISDLYLKQNNYNLALSYALKSLSINKQLGYKYGIASTLDVIARIYEKSKNYDKAIYYGKEALSLFTIIDNKEGIRENSLILFSAYKEKEDLNSALKYLELSMAMKDSVLGVEKMKMINNLEIKYALKEKQVEIELLQKDQKLNEAALEKKNLEKKFLLSGIIFLATISILFSIGLYYNRKLYNVQKNQAQEIIEKSLELESQKNEIEKKNEKLNALNNLLDEKVKKRTKALLHQNQRLLQYHFINSHKLRAPLASILGLVNLLKSKSINDLDQDVVDYLLIAANRLDSIIHDIQETLDHAEYSEESSEFEINETG